MRIRTGRMLQRPYARAGIPPRFELTAGPDLVLEGAGMVGAPHDKRSTGVGGLTADHGSPGTFGVSPLVPKSDPQHRGA